MTLKSITDKLTAEGATDVKKGEPYAEFGSSTKNIQPIYFAPPRRGQSKVAPKLQTMLLKKKGEDDYEYYESMPSILREPPTPTTPPRDFYFPISEAIAWFKGNGFTLLDESDIQMSRSGQYDVVTTKIINADNMIEPVEFMVSLDDQGNGVVRQVKK